MHRWAEGAIQAMVARASVSEGPSNSPYSQKRPTLGSVVTAGSPAPMSAAEESQPMWWLTATGPWCQRANALEAGAGDVGSGTRRGVSVADLQYDETFRGQAARRSAPGRGRRVVLRRTTAGGLWQLKSASFDHGCPRPQIRPGSRAVSCVFVKTPLGHLVPNGWPATTESRCRRGVQTTLTASIAAQLVPRTAVKE